MWIHNISDQVSPVIQNATTDPNVPHTSGFLLSYLRVCVSATQFQLQFVLILFIEALSMSHFVLSFQHFMIYLASLEHLVSKKISTHVFIVTVSIGCHRLFRFSVSCSSQEP